MMFSYGLVTEQKKGTYKYFIDMGDHMEVVQSRTAYVDEASRNRLLWSGFHGLLSMSYRSIKQSDKNPTYSSAWTSEPLLRQRLAPLLESER
jgi:hypothetical protein